MARGEAEARGARVVSEMTIAELAIAIGLKTDGINAKLDKILGETEKKTKSWGQKLASNLNKELGEKLGGALKMGALAGAAAFGVAFKDALDFDALLGDIAIGSDGAVGSIEVLRGKILSMSRATGVAKEEIAGGIKKFVELTGDGKAAADSMEVFARTAVATKAEMSDIAEVAAAMNQQLGIAPKQFDKAFSILIAGGKAGSVEFKNMAALLSEVAAAGSKFDGMVGTDGLASLSAAFQLVRQGFGGPQGANKAATSLVALMGEIGDKSKALRKVGVRVWEKRADGKTVKRDFRDIVKSLGKLTAKQRTEIFGLDAGKALEEILKVDGAWEQLTEKTKKANDNQTDYDKRQALASQRAANAWNAVKVAVAEAFTPERLQAFTAVLAKTLELAIDLTGWVSEILGMSNKVESEDLSRGVDDYVLKHKGKSGNYEQGLKDLIAAAESDDIGTMRGYFGQFANGKKSAVSAGEGDVHTVEALAQRARQKLNMIANQRKADAARKAAREAVGSVSAYSAGAAPAGGGAVKADVDVKVSLDKGLIHEETRKTVRAENDAALRETHAAVSGQEATP